MKYTDILAGIDSAYAIISTRVAAKEAEYTNARIFIDRVSYEDISLEDIIDSLLLPLLPYLIDSYARLPIEYRTKSYKVYVATLCELVKNGLVNGGILKTMDARMGITFDRNHHYSLLKKALQHEGIHLIKKNGRHQYEETIINEAGIPRNYHRTCLDIFTIYWKWLRNYDFEERKNFLESYFEDRPVDKNYIVDRADALKLTVLKSETQDFSRKIIKTCLRLDVVFSAIDSYPSSITDENFNEIAQEISSLVGFNILSIVRSNNIQKYILDYAKCVSFQKFGCILQGMPGNEEIILPNGHSQRIAGYSQKGFLGGRHLVRGNAYNVSYPISLTVDELFCIPLRTIQMMGNAVLYTSDEPIIAEIDGAEKSAHIFFNNQHEYLYVFYERIAPASFAYIDGIPIEVTQPFSKKVYIGKFWDHDLQQYQLGLFIAELRYADIKAAMKPVSVSCNGVSVVSSSTNHNGAFRIQERVYCLQEDSFTQVISMSFEVDGKTIESWKVAPEDFYFWNKQTGIRIRDKIEVDRWYGPAIGLVFSKAPISHCSVNFQFLYSAQGYNVYTVNIDFSAKLLDIDGHVFTIIQTEHPYISLIGEVDIISDEYCIEERRPLSIAILNYASADIDCYLLIEHDMAFSSYNIKNIQPEDLEDVSSLIENQEINDRLHQGKAGKWRLSLIQNNKCISEINVTVVPYITIQMDKPYYAEGEMVTVSVATRTPCFEAGGEYITHKELSIGKAAIEMVGNHVGVAPIDFDCYIDKCRITKHLRVNPRVWGLRCKDAEADAWESNKPYKLNYSEMKKKHLFICSTTEALITVEAANIKKQRYVFPGFSRINLQYLINNWVKQNTISFTDEYKRGQKLNVIYSPIISISDIVRNRDGLTISLGYIGPTSSLLHIQVFSGSTVVASTERNAYRNRFTLQIWISNDRLNSPDISVEARIDDQDYQTVYRGVCPEGEKEQKIVSFSFNQDTGIIELLGHPSSSEKFLNSDVSSKSLVSLISGGRNNGN